MKAVVFTGAGGNEVVRVEERPDPVPGPGEVLVHASVAGMNPADLHQRDGHYPAPSGVVPDVPGLEVAGVVERTGTEVSRWSPGDRVFGLVAGGGLAEGVAVPERHLAAVPANLDEEQAAAVPEAFVTAHDALLQANLRTGERVFVRGATGAVGSAAKQIARAMGAEVAGILLEGTAVDVVVDLVGGELVADDLAHVAMGGRIIVVSVAAGRRTGLDLLTLMRNRVTIRGTMLRARTHDEKAVAVEAFASEVVPMLADGRAQPRIDSVWSVDEIDRAFDRLAERGKQGKVLLRFGPDAGRRP